MNKILSFNNWKLQYWVGEFPNLSNVSTYELHEIINEPKNINIVKENKIGIELHRLYREPSSYGLLGIEFKPQKNSNELKIEIQYIKENIKNYNSEISNYDKTIYCGLLEDYVPHLKSKIIEMIYQHNIFFGGSLIVSCAANSEVGSSSVMFSIVAEIIVKIFKKFQEDTIVDFDDYVGKMAYETIYDTMKRDVKD